MTASEEDWPDLAGRLTEFGHVLPVRVYFEDTDFAQVVYHASYLRFMERGRSDYLRLLGIGHDALAAGAFGAQGLAFVVRRMTIDFHRPARIDEALVVETRVRQVGGASIALAQAVRRGPTPLVTADVTVVLVNATARPQRLPREVRERLSS